MHGDPNLVSIFSNLWQENKATEWVKPRKWGRKKDWSKISSWSNKWSEREMKDSKEREEECFVAMESVNWGKCMSMWGEKEGLK